MNLAFRPESEFLLPYVAAAGTLAGLSDEFMGHLAAALRERRTSVGRVLTTRGALSSLDISLFPLVLVSDFSEELEECDVLIEIVREVGEGDEGRDGHMDGGRAAGLREEGGGAREERGLRTLRGSLRRDPGGRGFPRRRKGVRPGRGQRPFGRSPFGRSPFGEEAT